MSHGPTVQDLRGTRNFFCGALVVLMVGANIVFFIHAAGSVPPWFTVTWLVLVDLVAILLIILIIVYYSSRIAKLKKAEHH